MIIENAIKLMKMKKKIIPEPENKIIAIKM
jgi:hypothetical protein